jgi:hypothetical protein
VKPQAVSESAWVAGLFDAGGHVHISPEHHSQDRIAFMQSGGSELLRIVQESFGGKLYQAGETSYVLILGTTQATELLEHITPYLRTPKLHEVRRFSKRHTGIQSSALSSAPKVGWIRIRCESCLYEFEQLSGRGRPPKRCTGCRDAISHYQWSQKKRSEEAEEVVA